MTIQGIVEFADQKALSNGATQFKLKVNGTSYSFYNEDPKAKPGDRVQFDAKQTADGRYWNAKGAVILGGTVAADAAPQIGAVPEKGFYGSPVRNLANEGDEERQDRIMRQNASSTAGHLIGCLIEKGSLKVSASDPSFDAFNAMKTLSEQVFLLNKNGYNWEFKSLKADENAVDTGSN